MSRAMKFRKPLLLSAILTLAGFGSAVAQVRLPVSKPTTTTAEPTAVRQRVSGPGPTGVTVTGSGIVGHVGWQSVEGATSYTVERWMASDEACCRATSPQLTALGWTDAGLQKSGTYVYRVHVSYADGRMGSTDVTYVRPEPQDPTGFTATATEPGAVRLTWNAVPGITQFLVHGPNTGPSGLTVNGTTATLSNVAAGPQEWTVASVYFPGGTLTPVSAWPKASANVSMFGTMGHTLFVEGTSTVVDLYFHVSRAPNSFRLSRTQASTGQTIEIQWPTSVTRTPMGNLDQVKVRTFPTDLAPQQVYRYQVHGTLANGSAVPGPTVDVTVPLLMVRTTLPVSGDRVILEWNQFGPGPYTVKKATIMVQGSTSVLAYDVVRDANGNPMSFTGFRWDDTTIQRGVTYHYQVCATMTSGMLCPGAQITVP